MRPIVIAMLATLSGCAPEYHLEFEHVTSPPEHAIVRWQEIRMDEGIAVGVVANPFDDDERLELETTVELLSQNANVLQVVPIEFDADAEEEKPDERRRGDWRFVIYGRGVGSTVVDVFIDEEREGQIPATVDEPLGLQ